MKIYSELVRGSFLNGIAAISDNLGNLLVSVFISRYLGPEKSGEWFFILWIATTTGILVSCGIPETIVRYIAESIHAPLELKKIYSNLQFRLAVFYIIFLLVGILVILVFVFTSKKYASNYILYFLLISFLFAAQRLSVISKSYLSGSHQFRKLALFTIISSIFQALSIYEFLKFGVLGAFITYSISFLIISIPTIKIFIGSDWKEITIPSFKFNKLDFSSSNVENRAFRYMLSAWLSTVVAIIIWQKFEIVFIDYFNGKREVGLFSAGLTISLVASQIPTYLTGALVPFFAREFGSGNEAGIESINFVFTKILSAIIFPIYFLLSILSENIVQFVYGLEYSSASLVVSILMVSAAFSSVSTVQSSLLHGIDKPIFLGYSGIFGVLLSMVFGFTLIPNYGIVGASIGRFIVQFSLVLALFVYVSVFLKMKFPVISILKILFASVVSSYAAFEVTKIGFSSSSIEFLISFLIGLTMYLIISKMLKVWSASEKKYLLLRFDSIKDNNSNVFNIIDKLFLLL